MKTLLLSLIFVASAASAQTVTYQRIGNMTYGSNGTVYQQIGNQTYGNDGSHAQRIGNQIYVNPGYQAQEQQTQVNRPRLSGYPRPPSSSIARPGMIVEGLPNLSLDLD